MSNFAEYMVMGGKSEVQFFGEKPAWLENKSHNHIEKLDLSDVDVAKFISRIGFYQR